MTGPNDPESPTLPRAVVEEAPRWSWVWILPMLAVALSAGLAWQAWGARGAMVTIQLDEGHGLKQGDALRYRGIRAGTVERVELLGSLGGLIASVRLEPQAADIARVGSRFWVVRPRFGWEGIGGLDTLIGARYLAVLPGRGAPQRHFIGLAEPPLSDALEPGLDVTLLVPRRAGLLAGSPVTFRQMRVGTVLSTGLASDGSSVVAQARVRQPYVPLVRERTRWWTTGGLDVEIGLTGLHLHLESLDSLVMGGVALAVPPDAGEVVNTGHAFDVASSPEDSWLEWRPAVSVGHSLLPPGVATPAPIRATLSWEEGRIFTGEEERSGWVLPVPGGLIGPAELLTIPEDAHDGTTRLHVAGESLGLDGERSDVGAGLVQLSVPLPSLPWLMDESRAAPAPEDCVIFTGPGTEPLSLAPGRLTEEDDGTWLVDPALSLGQDWHGAVVVGRSDGSVIGAVLIDDDEVRIAPLRP